MGRTDVKDIFGIKVVDAKTREPLFNGQVPVRWFCKAPNLLPLTVSLLLRLIPSKNLSASAFYLGTTLVLALGFFWVVWDPRKQTGHDKLAGTVVVHLKGNSSAPSENLA